MARDGPRWPEMARGCALTQVIGVAVADSIEAARAAAEAVAVEYGDPWEPPIYTIDAAVAAGSFFDGTRGDERTSWSRTGAALGTVMINLQQTVHDGKMTLRLFGQSDGLLRRLVEHDDDGVGAAVDPPEHGRGRRADREPRRPGVLDRGLLGGGGEGRLRPDDAPARLVSAQRRQGPYTVARECRFTSSFFTRAAIFD